MDGTIMLTYRILCDTDLNTEISIKELLENEKVLKAIKLEYAKGARNATFSTSEGAVLRIETIREIHILEVSKDDFADLLTLAEDDAKNKKLLKKNCERVELVDIETL